MLFRSDWPAAVGVAAAQAGVQLVAALQRLGGKLPVYERMLRSFVSDLAELPALLSACLQAQDSAAAARELHTLKGVAATLGLQALADGAGAAEKVMLAQAPAAGPAQRAAAAATVAEAIQRARSALPALLLALQPVLPPSHQAAHGSGLGGDTAAAATSMRELIALLENSDMRATEVMATLQPQCGDGTDAAWRALDEAVAALDFERAASLGRALLSETEQ